MDWSEFYENDGSENVLFVRTFSLQQRTKILQLVGDYNPFICYAFTVNYILGCGVLGVPFAFYKAGIVAGTAIIIAISFFSYLTVLWVGEASYRGMQIRKEMKNTNPFKSPKIYGKKSSKVAAAVGNTSIVNILNDGIHSVLSFQSLSSYQQDTAKSSSNAVSSGAASYVSLNASVRAEKERDRTSTLDSVDEAHEGASEMEVTDLVGEFIGENTKNSYQISLMILTGVGLLAYTQVFAQGFRSQIWSNGSNSFPILVFACIVVPLSCMQLSEQVTIQVFMAFMRFLSLGCLLLGTIYAINVAPTTTTEAVPLVESDGIGLMLTTSIFAQLFQHSVPGLVRPLNDSDKEKAPRIFGAALATTTVLYILIGVTSVAYFRQNINQSVNLNFANFYWGNDPKTCVVAVAVSKLIVLFPVLDTISVFPLIAITLGNNLNAFFPFVYKYLRSQFKETDKSTVKQYTLIGWRLVAAIPPVIMANYITNFSITLQLAGLCGIYVAFIIPALLQHSILSKFSLLNTKLIPSTPYTSYIYGQMTSVRIVYLLSFLAVCICSYQLLQQLRV